MARIFYDDDADIERVKRSKVAVIGYGSQGHAHAQNLRDSGVEVRVGLHPGSRSLARVEQDGLTAGPVDEVAAWADAVMVVAPDTAQPRIWKEQIAPHMRAGKTLLFAHGFNIRFRTIAPPPELDVALIAPKSPGHRLREAYQAGQGVPALLAIHQDASGEAQAFALSYAKALGSTRAGVLETTFAEETETDLFGEQAVLCGGISELVKAGFETLVEAGYQPEVAYFECLHELKLIVDLMYRGGLSYMRYSVSDTAEYGDYVSGPEVIDARTREAMRGILERVQSGAFAERMIADGERGFPELKAAREREQRHPIEEVGARLRQMMAFLDPVAVRPGDGPLSR